MTASYIVLFNSQGWKLENQNFLTTRGGRPRKIARLISAARPEIRGSDLFFRQFVHGIPKHKVSLRHPPFFPSMVVFPGF
jgi:hypothetical protein